MRIPDSVDTVENTDIAPGIIFSDETSDEANFSLLRSEINFKQKYIVHFLILRSSTFR